MNIQELATAVIEKIPVKIAISTLLSWHGQAMAGTFLQKKIFLYMPAGKILRS